MNSRQGRTRLFFKPLTTSPNPYHNASGMKILLWKLPQLQGYSSQFQTYFMLCKMGTWGNPVLMYEKTWLFASWWSGGYGSYFVIFWNWFESRWQEDITITFGRREIVYVNNIYRCLQYCFAFSVQCKVTTITPCPVAIPTQVLFFVLG